MSLVLELRLELSRDSRDFLLLHHTLALRGLLGVAAVLHQVDHSETYLQRFLLHFGGEERAYNVG
jgi:hypothetical protein